MINYIYYQIQNNSVIKMPTKAIQSRTILDMVRDYTKIEIDASQCVAQDGRPKYTKGTPLYTGGLKVCIATIFYVDFNDSRKEGFLTHHQPIKFVNHSALIKINKLMALVRGEKPRFKPTGLVFANEEYSKKDETYLKLVDTIKSSMEISYACVNAIPFVNKRRMKPVEIIWYKKPLDFILFSPKDGTWTTNQHGTNKF